MTLKNNDNRAQRALIPKMPGHLLQSNMHRHIRRKKVGALSHSSIGNRRQQRKNRRRSQPHQKHEPTKLKNEPTDKSGNIT